MWLPDFLLFIILLTPNETSSIKTGWKLDLPPLNKGIKKDILNMGNKFFKKLSPPPIITSGLITEEFIKFSLIYFYF